MIKMQEYKNQDISKHKKQIERLYEEFEKPSSIEELEGLHQYIVDRFIVNERKNDCITPPLNPVIQAIKDFREGKIDRETLIRIYMENETFSTPSICIPSRSGIREHFIISKAEAEIDALLRLKEDLEYQKKR